MKTTRIMTATILSLLTFAGCATIPRGANAFQPFEVDRYLGKWYEIARFDYRFERNMNNVTATYTLNDDGTIQVLNRGFDTIRNEWKQAIGKAKFRRDTNEARLKVSFFGPFYAAYNVIAMDADYKYALVAGSSTKYIWFLSREKNMPIDIKNDFLKIAKEIGYDISALIWVEHGK